MALEPIDYTTHCNAIEEAFQKVVRASDAEIDWLILTPNGQKQYTPDKTGTGFSEFLGSFEDSKVEYGLARVSPPGSDVQKLVLVGWCPDSAPMKMRASFASNFGVVANQVLKSYHVQITARDEDDLDERELLAKVSNAAGARYSIQTEGPTRTSSAPKPRPSALPKKVESEFKPSAIAKPAAAKPSFSNTSSKAVSNSADDDWDEPEIEERDLQSNPLKPNQSTYKPVGKIDLQKVIAEENSRQDPRLVNTVKSETSSKLNPRDDIEKLKKDSKAQRDAEIKKYLGTRPHTTTLPKKSDDMVVKGFQNEKSPAQIWAEKHQQGQPSTNVKPETSDSTEESEPEEMESPTETEEQAPQISDVKAKFEKVSMKEPQIIKPGQVKTPVPVTEEKSTQSAQKMPMGQPLPGMRAEIDTDSEGDNDDWDDEDEEQPTPKHALPTKTSTAPTPVPATAPRPQEPAREAAAPEPKATPTLPTRTSETTFVPPPPPRRNVPATTTPTPVEETKQPEPEEPEAPAKPAVQDENEEELPSAIAEYDNEAEEHNELGFKEGDKIVNIVFVDDDWWLGELENTGEKGLFPSNYVQLLE
ncbi:LANO_0A00870g1_1 [Lachancea nothofagi CBS 11611]|uniref:LANO_0A00870g1_1 n=1 Tax=Lachancea nothofagi CBS 11611 TaxID=1266666 RepID=A0A1G4IM31_9SACH|nr:LANO_0A00870g1_1 [Lachancea nothofagi CBS 11611]